MKYFLLSFLLIAGLSSRAQTNYGLNFSGSNYVDAGNSASLNANNIKAMECWVKFNSFTGDQEILAKSIGGQGIELLKFGTNIAAYFMRDGSNVSYINYPTSNLQTGRWYHLAVSWDGTKESIRLYINGISVGSRTDIGNINTTGLTNPAVSFRIGNWSDPTSRFLNGTVDEVRIWSVNRTATQIKKNMHLANNDEAGLIAYYKLNEGTGTSVSNSSTTTTGNTGTLINSPSWVASPVIRNANAVNFDGTNDFINLGTSSSLKFSNQFTIEFYANSPNWALASEASIVSSFQIGGYGISLSGTGFLQFQIRSNVSGSGYVGPTYPVSNLTNNTWYHIAGTFDGRMMRLFVNGNQVSSYDLGSNGTVFYSYPNNPVFIGADPTTDATPQGLYYTGSIDEVRLWNVARTQAQIQSSINKEIDPEDVVNNAGLVSYYKFNQGITSGNNAGLVNIIDQKGTNNGEMNNFNLTGTTTNYVAQPTVLVVLPVTYKSFTAKRQGTNVLVEWSTLQEQNTAYFILQHSTNERDWKNISQQQASGNSNTLTQYNFIHQQPAKGLNLYRLMQTDKDGKSSLSKVIKINLDQINAGRILSTYITDNRIRLQLDKPTDIALFTAEGRLLMKRKLAAGQQVINVSNYTKGIYLLKLGEHSEKIMIK